MVDASSHRLPFTTVTSAGHSWTLQAKSGADRSPSPPAVKSFRSASRLGLAPHGSSRIMDVNADLHHPHLIGDCLIQIFTLLNEEDLIIASSVCRVSRVPLCGSSRTCANNVIIPLKCPAVVDLKKKIYIFFLGLA